MGPLTRAEITIFVGDPHEQIAAWAVQSMASTRMNRRLTTLGSIALSLATLSVLSSGCAANSDDEDAVEGAEAAIEGSGGRSDTCTDPTMPSTQLPCASSNGEKRTSIRRDLVNNASFFEGDYFRRFELKPDPRGPFKLTDSVSKPYVFPTLYTDVTSSIAMFFCSLDRAKALMPDPAMTPVDMGYGRGVVIFSSTRFNRIYGMEGYNEVVITIPVVVDRIFTPPVLPLLMGEWKGLGFYVISVPVSSEENRIRGDIWGMPKVLQEISLKVENNNNNNGDRDSEGGGDDYVTSIKDDAGQVYASYRVPMTGDGLDVDSSNYVYSMLGGRLVRSQQHAHGKYVKTTWSKTLAIPNLTPDRPYLTLSATSPAAAKLRGLEIAAHPFQVRFGKDTDSALELPDTEFRAR